MSEFPRVHTITGKYAVIPHVHAYVIDGEKSSFIVDATHTLSNATELRQCEDSLLNTYHPVKDQENNSFLPTFEMDIYMAEIYKQRPYVGA